MKVTLTRSTLLHLRVPFSIFLLPVFLFALSNSRELVSTGQIVLGFLIIHLLLYPASNGYNSWFDKDEESIGGLKTPPKVTKDLYYTSLTLDGAAVLLGLLISPLFSLLLLVYGLISKAYSHPNIRLKKYGVASWLVAAVFQGGFSYYMTISAVSPTELGSSIHVYGAALATLMLAGFYPLTQIYQHKEDTRRGDRTLSLLLGVKGTFLFSFIFFGLSAIGFGLFYSVFYDVYYYIAFLSSQLFLFIYFIWWWLSSLKEERHIAYRYAMISNWLGSLSLSAFFAAVIFISS